MSENHTKIKNAKYLQNVIGSCLKKKDSGNFFEWMEAQANNFRDLGLDTLLAHASPVEGAPSQTRGLFSIEKKIVEVCDIALEQVEF